MLLTTSLGSGSFENGKERKLAKNIYSNSDFGWIYGLSVFQHFLKKWTLNVIFGLLDAVMSKTKLWDFTVKTRVRIESNENKS